MMKRIITEEEIESLKEDGLLVIRNMIFGSFEQGENKTIELVFDLLTQDFYFAVESQNILYHAAEALDEAIESYNEL